MESACSTYGREKSCRVLVGKRERRIPLGRLRHTWKDNIKMDLPEVRCGAMDSIGLAQGKNRWRAVVNAVINVWASYNVEKFLTS
jgi:hypothetical protein